MSKWVAGCLAVIMVSAFLFVTCGFVTVISANEKHTGPVTVRRASSPALEVEFIRPNGEFFEMRFEPDGAEPKLNKGDVLSDLVYTDLKNHREFFVKATLVSEAPALPIADKVLYDQESPNYTSSGQGWIIDRGASHRFYLWSDGGYHEKPEKKK